MKSKFTLMLFYAISLLLVSMEAKSQIARKVYGGPANETNAHVQPSLGGFHYIISKTGTGTPQTIHISRYDAAGNMIWRKNYTGVLGNTDEVVSTLEDRSGALVLLVNDVTPPPPPPGLSILQYFKIVKINAAGGLISFWSYAPGLIAIPLQHTRGVKIMQSFTDDNYYVIGNRIPAGANQLDVGVIFRIDNLVGSVLHQNQFQYNFNGTKRDIGFYDLAQINATNWVISGAYLPLPANTRYNNLALVYNFSGTGSIVAVKQIEFDQNNHEAFDRVVVDQNRGRIYFGYHLHTTNIQHNIGVVCTDYLLNVTWRTRITPVTGEAERMSSMIYDAVSDQILTSGFSVSTDHGFITSFSPTGIRNWTKIPSGLALNAAQAPFRIALSANNTILYSSDIQNGGNRDLTWGSTGISGEPGACFNPKAYNAAVLPFVQSQDPIDLSDPMFYRDNTECAVADMPMPEQGVCANCVLPGDVIKYGYAVLLGSNFWGTQTQGAKYYIDGVLTVPSGATLDITNVDVIFGKNGAIVFQDGAILRANNSVFRPCDPDLTWKGISFQGNAKGVVNNCIFKNAAFALDIANGRNQLKITNNQFSNCLVSIRITNTHTEHASVTGNKFFADYSDLDFGMVNPVYLFSNTYTGVLLRANTESIVISQNEFLLTRSAGNVHMLYGIYATQSNTDISSNAFTSCYRAVDLLQPLGFSVENNKMEVTRKKHDQDYQVKVTSSGALLATIANNQISNFNMANEFISTQAAIYADFSSYLKIHDNEIKGFETGLKINQLTGAKIYSNHITGCHMYGIHAENCMSTTIKCNVIDMNYTKDNTRNCAGIRYYQTLPHHNNLDIRGNCILNTYDAIVLFSSMSWVTIPVIRNNYLYNYIYNGIYNDNFTGSIGTAAAAPGAGKNVFISNNYNPFSGAIDIYSTVLLYENGNYNIMSTGGMVGSMGGSNHSSASCGHFFAGNNNNAQRIEQEDKCDSDASSSGTLIPRSATPPYAGLFVKPEGSLGYPVADHANTYERLVHWSQTARSISATPFELEKFTQWLATSETNNDVKLLVQAYVNILAGKHADASTALLQVNKPEWKTTVERMQLLNTVSVKGFVADETTRARASLLVQDNDFFAAALGMVFEPWHDEFHYTFASDRPYERQKGDYSRIDHPVVTFSVYPNPVKDGSFKVNISTPNNSESTLYIRDLLGRTLFSKEVPFSAGTLEVSVNDLPLGIYIASVESTDNVLKTEKIVISGHK
ncbi:MAG: right-handed parallel beta-helix repeat-containing protein [Bacteroidota bacterium]